MIIAIPSPGLIMSSAVSSSDDFLIPVLWRRVANVATTPDHYSLFQQATSAPVSLLTDSTFLWVSHICWWESISRDTLKISRRNCIFQPWLLKPLSILFCNFQSHHSYSTLFFWLLAKKLSIWSSFEKFFEFVFQLDFYFHVHLFPFLLPTILSSACLLVFAFLLMFYISLRILSLVLQQGFSTSHGSLTWNILSFTTIFLQVNYLDTEEHLCTTCKITADSTSIFSKIIRPCWQKECPLKWATFLCSKYSFFSI